MSVINPDLFLKHELEFEIKSRGGRPQGDVASLRKQLRDALASGGTTSLVKVTDVMAELELCQEKWGELREVMEDFESAPSNLRARQRVRQRAEHLQHRLENLSAQTTIAEVSATLKLIAEQVAKALRNFEPVKSPLSVSSPQPPEMDIAQTPNPAAPLPTPSGGASVSYNN